MSLLLLSQWERAIVFDTSLYYKYIYTKYMLYLFILNMNLLFILNIILLNILNINIYWKKGAFRGRETLCRPAAFSGSSPIGDPQHSQHLEFVFKAD